MLRGRCIRTSIAVGVARTRVVRPVAGADTAGERVRPPIALERRGIGR